MLEGCGLGNGEDLGARSHDLADQLVAELDGGADEVAVALLQNAFFLAGLDEGFDIDGGFVFEAAGALGQRRDGEEETDEDGDRRDQPE